MKRTKISEIRSVDNGTDIKIQGRVETIRDIGKVVFAMIRDRSGLVQTTIDKEKYNGPNLQTNDIVTIYGVSQNSNVRNGIPGLELSAHNAEIINRAEEEYPIAVLPKSMYNLDTILDHRAISLRNPNTQEMFRIQSSIAEFFGKYLRSQDFTQIFTSKIVSQGAEGGANVFSIDYFGTKAFLAQSPQFYKQIMVGSGLERVFEIGHVYRAEKHNTSRHLNEYISMDIEIGFINNFSELMDLEENLIKHIFTKISEKYGTSIKNYAGKEITIPNTIPRVTFDDAIEIIRKKYNYKGPHDITPEGEKLITQYMEETQGSDLVFITHYPLDQRPFYTMPTGNGKDTESFDLIYRGLEITTGGQRIHKYNQLVDNAIKFGLRTEDITGYLEAFKYGMPPHGGMALGLERITARILNISNVKEATLFPRDQKRLTP